MNEETQLRIFNLLDVLAVEIVESRKDINERIDSLQTEMRQGFDRLERRLGNVETRVEGLEDAVEGLETRFEGLEIGVERLTIEQRSFRQEFELRIAPLER